MAEKDVRELFLSFIRETGSLGVSARKSGSLRRVVLNWLAEDPSFREDYQEALDEFHESIHMLLLDKAKAGDGASIRFLAQSHIPGKYSCAAKTSPPPTQPGVIWRDG